MTKQDKALVAETKSLISDVETGNTDRPAWLAIQDRVRQLYEPRTQAAVAGLLGKSPDWVARILHWNPTAVGSPFADTKDPGKRAPVSAAKKALADPAQRKKVLKTLSPAELGEVVAEADEERHVKTQAVKGEHRKPDAAGAVLGGGGESSEQAKASLTESWADELIQRVQFQTGKLGRHVKKWGLVLGSLDEAEALEMVEEAERNIAEVRAALQERVRDAKSNTGVNV